MSADKKAPEPLKARHTLPDWDGPRDERNQPVRLRHGELTRVEAPGMGACWRLYTKSPLSSVMWPGYFDQSPTNAPDLRAGDWIFATCSVGSAVLEPAMLFVDHMSDDLNDSPVNFRPATLVNVTCLAGRPAEAVAKRRAA